MFQGEEKRMSMGLRIVLIVVSLGSFAYMIKKIRKSQIRIVDASFWILFSIALIILALFPNFARILAEIVGVASTVNFVFLVVIFLLLVGLFSLSIKVSKLESKIIDMAGEIAINHKEENTNIDEKG